MTAVRGSAKSHGYCSIGMPEMLPMINADEARILNLPQYQVSAYAPHFCSGNNVRFNAELFEIWRDAWVRSPIVNYDGEQSMLPAWEACDKYLHAQGRPPLGLCCREKFMEFVPFDILRIAYKAANRVLPSDWTYDLHVREAGLPDDPPPKNLNTQSHSSGIVSFQEDDDDDGSSGIWYDTDSVSASRTFYNNPRLYRLGGDSNIQQ